NKKTLENDFIKGTPDVILTDKVVDIKTSWDIWTFLKVDETSANKAYLYQLLGYMWLTDTKKADLVYCLVDTPDDIMHEELRRLSYRYPEIDQSEEKAAVFKRNFQFG